LQRPEPTDGTGGRVQRSVQLKRPEYDRFQYADRAGYGRAQYADRAGYGRFQDAAASALDPAGTSKYTGAFANLWQQGSDGGAEEGGHQEAGQARQAQ
jgi:hypothetical protein